MMQPCYGIKPERLTQYYADLRAIGVGAVEDDPFTKAMLCLSGLHYAFSYYKKARSGSEFETFYGPSHRLDDRLDYTAGLVINRLMRGARSRTVTESISLAKPHSPVNEEWFGWQLAWISTGSLAKGDVQAWLYRVGIKEGWLRLSIATGIVSLWAPEAVGFIHSMMQKPFPPLIPNLDAEKNMQVMNCIKTFIRDPQVDMEEF